MATEDEVREVLADLTWLNNCHCGEGGRTSADYFVPAGQMITPEALNWARACPARRQEVLWAYGRKIKAGYFGGLSAGQRAAMSLEQALEFIATDLPVVLEPTLTLDLADVDALLV